LGDQWAATLRSCHRGLPNKLKSMKYTFFGEEDLAKKHLGPCAQTAYATIPWRPSSLVAIEPPQGLYRHRQLNHIQPLLIAIAKSVFNCAFDTPRGTQLLHQVISCPEPHYDLSG
jgi:hypothetical protein